MNQSVRKTYDEAFKRHAVELWRSSNKSRKEIAEQLGINEWALRDWDRALKKRTQPVPPLTKDELEAENLRLRKENAQLRAQTEILKKTLGIISKP